MIAFRKEHAVLRKSTGPASCGLPEISIHNGYPFNNRTDYNSRLIGVMFAGRDEADTRDDVIFYGMNDYWEPINMQLPELPCGKKWKVCVNTAVPYADGQSPEQFMNNTQNNNLRIEPRTVVILTAE